MKPQIVIIVGGDGNESVEHYSFTKEISIGVGLSEDGVTGDLPITILANLCSDCGDFHFRLLADGADMISLRPSGETQRRFDANFPVPEERTNHRG